VTETPADQTPAPAGQAPAGWYPDPTPQAGAPSLRYWDGAAWTAHTAPGTTPAAPTGPTTPDGVPLAGWWWRVLSYVIDSVIIGFASGIVGFPAQLQVQRDLQPIMDRFTRGIEQNPDNPPDFGAFVGDYLDILQQHAFWLVAPGAILTAVYWAVFLRWKGATPGKLMLGMRVRLREQEGTLPWRSIIARMTVQFGVSWTILVLAFVTGSATLFIVSMVTTLFIMLDPLWATWDSKRQTLHDKLARTNVVRSR
jgi:uncharacterized RDD family membrane protein YckC